MHIKLLISNSFIIFLMFVSKLNNMWVNVNKIKVILIVIKFVCIMWLNILRSEIRYTFLGYIDTIFFIFKSKFALYFVYNTT